MHPKAMHSSNHLPFLKSTLYAEALRTELTYRQQFTDTHTQNQLHRCNFIPAQLLLSFLYKAGFQCTAGCSPLLPFPCRDGRRDCTARFPQALCRSNRPSVSSRSVQEAGGDCSSGSDYKSTVLLLLMKSP